MKKSAIALAITVMAFVAVSNARAQMVDIGSGQMERSEFIALKAMVQGKKAVNGTAIYSPIVRPERYGMVEMAREEFKALRDQVFVRPAFVKATVAVKTVRMVDIGTGEMPRDDFIALKRMVEKTDACMMGHVAYVLP
jgi:hypothetical protein